MSDEQNGKRHQVWRARWLWLTALAACLVLGTFAIRPRPVAAHLHPVFQPPAEIAAAMKAQGSTQMPSAAAVKAAVALLGPPTPPSAAPSASAPPSTPPASAAAPAQALAAPVDHNGVLSVTFQYLSDFRYDPPEPPPGMEVTTTLDAPQAPPPKQVIPAKILALNAKRVAIQGFMIPLDMDSGKTRQFALVAVIPGCFYCQPPGLNEYVLVTMKDGQAVDYPGATPVLVTGKFAVGEMRDGDVVTSLYRMEGEAVTDGVVDQPKQQF